jgi:hypothetical protein
MRFTKKTLLALLALGVLSTANLAYAEEDKNISDTIMHLEQGSVDAAKSDFSASTLHLKAARNSSEQIQDHEAAKKAGMDQINNSLKEVRLGHPETAVDEIKKAIAIYKGL